MLNHLTIADLARHLASREVSAREGVLACLDQVQKIEGQVHALLHVDAAGALKQADAADAALRAGVTHEAKPLLGIPLVIKDVIAVREQPLTCGSRILGSFVSPYDATVVARLREAGAVFLGRANMDEFAMGSSTENSAFGPTRNPWDLSRTPGGSSGGAAAAVAACECVAALGSDTGGSVRQPAAFCGVVGLKPTYGRVSRYGLVAYASSLDQIGPLARTTADAALLLDVIGGHDSLDSTSVPGSVDSCRGALDAPVRGFRLGLPKEYFVDGMDGEVRAAVDEAIGLYQQAGVEVLEISLPHTRHALAAYYLIATAEASANLARFDGVRYGHRKEGADLLAMYRRTRGTGFGREVKRRILLGTYALSSGYYDAYYLRAQKVRTLIRRDFLKAFEQVDAILTPTAPTPAFRLGEKVEDPLQMYLSDIFTISANLAGICGLSLPCGFSRNPRLPIGLQLLGKPFGESTLVRLGRAYEQRTPWHGLRPPLASETETAQSGVRPT